MIIVDALQIILACIILLLRQRFLAGIYLLWCFGNIELIQLYNAHKSWAFLQLWMISVFAFNFTLALICSVKRKNFVAGLISSVAFVHLIAFIFARNDVYIFGDWRGYFMLLISAGLLVSTLIEGRNDGKRYSNRNRVNHSSINNLFFRNGFARVTIKQANR